MTPASLYGMVLGIPTRAAAVGGVTPYDEITLGIEPASLLAYWQLKELSGTAADNAEGTAARDGTYSNVTLNSIDGAGASMGRAGLWNGTTSYCNVYSASLAGAFNPLEGTIACWLKVSAAGVWTDGATRAAFGLSADANNYIRIAKDAANNSASVSYVAGSTVKVIAVTVSSTAWLHLALTWNKAQDRVRCYVNGTQSGATLTGLGTWAGALASNRCVIGAALTTPLNLWSGYLHHAPLWSKELTAQQIATLAAPV